VARKRTRLVEQVSWAEAEILSDTATPNYDQFRSVESLSAGDKLIDEDQRVQCMKRHGLTIPQIAEKLAIDQQSVRKRLQLLRLTADEQQT
jgi:hypothetical protein